MGGSSGRSVKWAMMRIVARERGGDYSEKKAKIIKKGLARRLKMDLKMCGRYISAYSDGAELCGTLVFVSPP